MTDYRSLGLDERDSGGSIGWKYVLTSANTQLLFCHCPVWQSHASAIIHLPEEGEPPPPPPPPTPTVQRLRWVQHLICLNASWSMSAINLKHNHFWLNWTHISASAGMNFSLLLLFFFYVSFIHSSLKYIKSRPAPFTPLRHWGYSWSPEDWKFPLL